MSLSSYISSSTSCWPLSTTIMGNMCAELEKSSLVGCCSGYLLFLLLGCLLVALVVSLCWFWVFLLLVVGREHHGILFYRGGTIFAPYFVSCVCVRKHLVLHAHTQSYTCHGDICIGDAMTTVIWVFFFVCASVCVSFSSYYFSTYLSYWEWSVNDARKQPIYLYIIREKCKKSISQRIYTPCFALARLYSTHPFHPTRGYKRNTSTRRNVCVYL